ncbi:MAG: carbon storage regulator [Betaproteobacteria bacterium]|nr:MAG: carbon storage regulator [Betaproteobacteria bacterium]
MLVLSRRLQEKILIGKDIIVSVEALGDQRVKIGIDAPPEVQIFRTELIANMRAEDGPLDSGTDGGGE